MKLIYQFRFATSQLLAEHVHQTHTQTMYALLSTLVSYGYLAKRYDSSYRLAHRSAEYYATPQAVHLFRTYIDECSERELKQLYARPVASVRFIDRSLAIFRLYLSLRRVYKDRLHFWTKPMLNTDTYDHFPTPLPDAHYTIDTTRHFFVEYFDSAVSVGIHGRRISTLVHYDETGDWDYNAADFPVIIILCDTETMRVKAEKRVRYLLRDSDSEIRFIVVTHDTLNADIHTD